jgi:hypothetical protein
MRRPIRISPSYRRNSKRPLRSTIPSHQREISQILREAKKEQTRMTRSSIRLKRRKEAITQGEAVISEGAEEEANLEKGKKAKKLLLEKVNIRIPQRNILTREIENQDSIRMTEIMIRKIRSPRRLFMW